MLKIRLPRSLRARMMSFMGMLFLGMAVLIIASTTFFIYNTEQATLRARQQEAAQYASKQVEEYIGENENVLEWLDQYWFGERKENSKTLQAVFEDYPSFMEILFLDANGGVLLNATQEKSVLANQFTIPQSQWFLSAKAGENMYSDIQITSKDESYLIFSMPSKHGGVMAAQIKMDELWEKVSKIHFGESGTVFIIDEKGRVIAHTNSQIVLSHRSLSDSAQLQAILEAPNHEWYGNAENFNDVDVVSASTEIKDTGWIIITEISQREAFASSRKAATFIPILIFVLITIVTLIFRNALTQQILKPLDLLRQGASQIGLGNLDFRIQIPRKDEFGEVMAVFNEMAVDLEKNQGNLQKAIAYEYESQRARELDILLKASEATSSTLDFDTVMHTLASQLIEISGFECCFISEWDKDLNSIIGRLDHSRIFWREDLRESYSMSDYPRSTQVLLTGTPIILQGDFEAEEKQWMEELNRTAVIVLALFAAEKVIGLVELESLEKKKVFDPSVLEDCQRILSNAAAWILDPLPSNEPKKLFEIAEALLQTTGASVCSFSEWDKPRDCVRTTAVFSNTSWKEGQGPRFNPNQEVWKDALYQGSTSVFENSKGGIKLSSVVDNYQPIAAESLIVLPLQKGSERIGVIELYDFNHEIRVTPEQITIAHDRRQSQLFNRECASAPNNTKQT